MKGLFLSSCLCVSGFLPVGAVIADERGTNAFEIELLHGFANPVDTALERQINTFEISSLSGFTGPVDSAQARGINAFEISLLHGFNSPTTSADY